MITNVELVELVAGSDHITPVGKPKKKKRDMVRFWMEVIVF